MKIVTICGSMKFQNEMQRIALSLETKHKYNVLQCIYFNSEEELSSSDIDSLKKAHYKKIDISDAIYVVDIGGYIGSSTKKEISYAKENKKEIIMHSKLDL